MPSKNNRHHHRKKLKKQINARKFKLDRINREKRRIKKRGRTLRTIDEDR